MEREGFSATVYTCPAGKQSIGYGFNLEAGITKGEALALLRYKLEYLESILEYTFPWFAALGRARKDVLIEMAFQMGVEGLLEFKKTLAAVAEGRYKAAALEMLNSRWGKIDTPGRAKFLSEIMERGTLKAPQAKR